MEDIFAELAAAGSDDEGRQEEEEIDNPVPREDEAEEVSENKTVVKPKRTVSRPRPKLDPARLLGPRGIFVVTKSFEGIKFKGKGHELDDLNNVLSRLQHWCHRLFPKMTFENCVDRIEELGSKREILTNMHKIRMGMVDVDGNQDNDVVEDRDDDVRELSPQPVNDTDSAFNQLVGPPPAQGVTLTDEQRARILRNRLLAEERKMARLQAREKEMEERRRAEEQAVATDGAQGNSVSSQPHEITNSATEPNLAMDVDPLSAQSSSEVNPKPSSSRNVTDGSESTLEETTTNISPNLRKTSGLD